MNKRISTSELADKIDRLQDTLNVIVELQGAVMATPEKVELEESETMMCPAHPGEVMYRREGPYGTFYNHGKEIGPDRWVNCQGKGWKMKKVE